MFYASGLIASIQAHAKRTPSAPAIASPDRNSLSYAQLWGLIETIGSAFQKSNLSGDQTIALSLPDGPELLVACLAISSVAQCAVLNPSSTRSEFEYYLSDLNAGALLVSTEKNGAANTAAKQLRIPVFSCEPVQEADAGVFRIPSLPQGESAVERQARKSEEIALLIYTSGTTAQPKAVAMTHQMLNDTSGNTRNALQLSSSDRCLNVMPMFHAHALLLAAASTLSAGGTIICTSGFDSERFFDWLEKTTPSWYTAAPTIHKAVLKEAGARPFKSNFLRFIRSSASALPQHLLNRLENVFQVPVIEGYGMTECPLIASNPKPPGVRKPGSVGRPCGPEISIVDEAGTPVSAGETGEIRIRGTCVTGDSGDWFPTGDSGFFDSDGYLFLKGRLKEIINRGGQKIGPLEVDSVLLQHPSVAEAASFGFAHESLGEDIAAAVVLNKNAQATERELRNHLLEKLVSYKVPRRILIVDELPRNATGKVIRNQLANGLQTSLAQKPASGGTIAASTNRIEAKLKHLWMEVLELPSIGINDDFFKIGGESILATRLLSRVRNTFQIDLDLRTLFEAPTIAELSQIIRNYPAPKNEVRLGHHDLSEPVTIRKKQEERSDQENIRTGCHADWMNFSLLFFSADGSISTEDKYGLLLESAKFADENGFAAIWTPERHFHSFGGLYPNPAVLSSALAMITRRIRLRAGSVVIPLQNPLRVAEEWAVVDNLSGGRVEISCASGWHANDFVLSPDDYADRRKIMFERIEIIRKLWHGERIELPNGAQCPVEVGIFPRPIQTVLPIWLSCHSDDTFRIAGRMNLNVITTLYKTTLDRIAEQISIYRKALEESGHDPNQRTAALMLHTFIAEDVEEVETKIKSAYSNYLQTFLGLQKNQADGLRQDFDLTDADKEFLISRGVDRLYDVRDLIGTPETCLKKVNDLRSIGINEIACLIDFGIDHASVLSGLHQINKLRIMSQTSVSTRG